jgi:two-component system response regulator YesN
MVGFFSLLMDDGTGCYSGRSEEEPPFSPAEEIVPLKDLEEWSQWSRQSFADLQSLFSLRRSRNFPVPLVKAIAYIDSHFTDQVQLSNAADAAQVSGAYLSRLFTEHLHTTFVDYVTELRIGRAEELIRESRMSIKEISYAVGYQDPNYFTKIFRKATGLAPSLYGAERRAEREQA